jgi:hypothetical protein
MSATTSTDVSFTRYGPSAATALHGELEHLRSLDRSRHVPTGSPHLDGDSPDAQVLTASVAGRLVGYVRGHVSDIVDVEEVVVAAQARRSHPDLAGLLVEAFVEGAFLPWADVTMPREATALAYMISCGWSPAEGGPEGGTRVRLSAARGVEG